MKVILLVIITIIIWIALDIAIVYNTTPPCPGGDDPFFKHPELWEFSNNTPNGN